MANNIKTLEIHKKILGVFIHIDPTIGEFQGWGHLKPFCLCNVEVY